jgi:hypothetical protein
VLQRLFPWDERHLAGLDLTHTASHLRDLRFFDLRRNVVGERLDEAISKLGALGWGELLYFGKYLGHGLRHGENILAASPTASVQNSMPTTAISRREIVA